MSDDEAATYIISFLDLDTMMQEAADGIEVAATLKSLERTMHQMVHGVSTVSPLGFSRRMFGLTA